MLHRLWITFIRFCFHHFYNTFAFTYDFVSAVVSRGHWRAWTRAAIPYIRGTRVLEIPCGTGNLLVDLHTAGLAPIGVDLSSSMLHITQRKARFLETFHGMSLKIARARAQQLPFPGQSFDSIVMTFPPGFVRDPRVLAEFQRLLADDGRLIWVDAGRLLPHDVYSRLLNLAFDVVDGSDYFIDGATKLLMHAEFDVKIETVRDEASVVMVAIARKQSTVNS
ncbi:MAG: class I SAM-dependent methyltransferase [Chloroflexi bacterium]|nr:class I SAM-dependent methyltransferase [Chloroflexota bacterium]